MDAHIAPRQRHVMIQGARPRLLVVDDAAESREVIAEYFGARGYEVLVAADGVEALAQTITGGVDVIIMHATLPGLEGYEAAPILRKINPRVQIILTAGAEVEGRPRESQRTERFRCFPKPLNLEEIAGTIEKGAAWSGPEVEHKGEGGG
jgi:CheY-like chemotaxis protein